MKRLTAFFTAFVLFLVTAAGIHLTVRDKKIPDSHTFSTWANETKTRSRETIKQNLNSHSLLVFGSSEFMHGQDTPYHPSSMFADSDFQPMLIGAGYYQSLSHAIALSALGEGQKKAVLFLSEKRVSCPRPLHPVSRKMTTWVCCRTRPFQKRQNSTS